MGHRPSAATLESELATDELAFLLDLVRRASLKGWHLEIGTAAGGTLCRLMRCFDPDGMPQFVVVDPMTYFPDQMEIIRRNLRRHQLDPAKVDFRVAKSAEAFLKAEAEGDRYDFMLIDGAHKIRHVTMDLRWTRLLQVGGLVCLHDYNSRHKGVSWPVNRFLRRHRNYHREALMGSLIVLRKESPSLTAEIDRGDILWSMILSPWLQVERSLRKRLGKPT